MTRLAAPAVIAAHVATLPTLPAWAGVQVYEGAATDLSDVAEYVTVGYVAGDGGGAVTLEPVPTGQGGVEESGTILCQVIVLADDVPAARARVFDLLADWTGWVGQDRTLSSPTLILPSEVHLAADVALSTTRQGATASAVVTITYSAATYG